MQKRPTQGNNMPGYTGYVSAQIGEEREAAALQEMTIRKAKDDAVMRNKVPGYQGFVPQVRSENVFGETFGKSTLAQKEGKIKAGFDLGSGERYKSVNQGVYTD